MFIKNEQKRLSYQMLVFDEVVKRGSFTSAAEVLGHTKSAVSQYVSQLEADLGVRLLNRSTRKLNLTHAGQQLAIRSEQLVKLLSATLDEIATHGNQPSGRLAITAPHAFDPSLITPLITALSCEYPDIEPELIFTDERLDLLEHQLDLAISVGLQKDSSYHAVHIGQLDNILVASPAYLARQKTVNIHSFSSQKLVMLPWQHQTALLSDQGKELLFSSTKQLRVNTSTSAINSVLCGAGISLIPRIFVQKYLASGELQRVLVEFKGPDRDVYALHPYGKQLPFVIRCFIERLKTSFNQAGLSGNFVR